VTRDQEFTLRNIRALMERKGNQIVSEHMSGKLLLVDVDGPQGQKGQIIINQEGIIVARRKRNAGPGSKRKTKKTIGTRFMDSPEFAHLGDPREEFARYVRYKSKKTKEERKARRGNPRQLLFRTRAAALKYAREHGAKRFSIKKLKRGK
jgi:hypothetical protein